MFGSPQYSGRLEKRHGYQTKLQRCNTVEIGRCNTIEIGGENAVAVV